MSKFDAVLFDCDGVLVDSDGITNRVLRDMLEELGWKLGLQECVQLFNGKTLKHEIDRVAAAIGRPVPDQWIVQFRVGGMHA